MRFGRWKICLFSAIVAVTSFMGVASAWAEEGAEKAGLPQMKAEFFPGQIFWFVVTFAFLYASMKRVILPIYETTQGKRQNIISGDLKAAGHANDEARRMMDEYEDALTKARASALASLDTSKAAQEALVQQAEQKKQLVKQVHQAEVRIGTARDSALKEINNVAADIATVMLDKITGNTAQVRG
jgi:F-type H+-transporting ATPase subunit b